MLRSPAKLRSEYEGRPRDIDADVTRLLGQDASLQLEELHAVRRRLLEAEKDAVDGAYRTGLIDEESRDRLRRAIDAHLHGSEQGSRTPRSFATDLPERRRQWATTSG
jgi:hypothetical protein